MVLSSLQEATIKITSKLMSGRRIEGVISHKSLSTLNVCTLLSEVWVPGMGLESPWIPQPNLPHGRWRWWLEWAGWYLWGWFWGLLKYCIVRNTWSQDSLTMSLVRSDHCSVNIGDGVVVTGNYPESNTVNMWVGDDRDGVTLRNPIRCRKWEKHHQPKMWPTWASQPNWPPWPSWSSWLMEYFPETTLGWLPKLFLTLFRIKNLVQIAAATLIFTLF